MEFQESLPASLAASLVLMLNLTIKPGKNGSVRVIKTTISDTRDSSADIIDTHANIASSSTDVYN